MQFKNPELLWALFLLIIPIFIHLFQLRRFKKTPFTNVKLLQKIVAESRKSNNLKKWLLLAARSLLFTALIIAFAQPFFADETALKEKETIIYLDDSFSMQARYNESTLLEHAVQQLLKSIPEEEIFSLFTNSIEYRNITIKDIQNNLLTLTPTPKQLKLGEIQLKAKTLFSKNEQLQKNLILISDFQERMQVESKDSIIGLHEHIVQLTPNSTNNGTLDSLYISSTDSETIELTALLSANFDTQSIPVSLYNEDKLIAKTSATFENRKGSAIFTLASKEAIKGTLEISDAGLTYDNRLFFNIDEKEKPKVLVIGKSNSDFLKKIYTDNEFEFNSYGLETLNYREIDTQHLIIINELQQIPNSLIPSITAFVTDGGNLIVIPPINADIVNYNQLLTKLSVGSYAQQNESERKITQISFSHPLFQHVFQKEIANFQYPMVKQYLKINATLPPVLSYQNNEPFLVGGRGMYVFTASLNSENSNFKRSPLIVPTFYKMGVNSLKTSEIYNTLNGNTKIDVARKLAKDHILKVSKDQYQFIPQQQSLANKVTLIFNDSPAADGIYSISENGTILKNISFNYPRYESSLDYLELDNLGSVNIKTSISSLFQELQIDNRVTELWKWFVILAVLFILIEVLIIKYLR